ncbi:unnamed protein product, partial [Urochloa humidicola]
SGFSYQHHQPAGGPVGDAVAPYDDSDHNLTVLLTFGIFFSFIILYLVTGVIWASAATACAVALSFCYLKARRRAEAWRGPACGRRERRRWGARRSCRRGGRFVGDTGVSVQARGCRRRRWRRCWLQISQTRMLQLTERKESRRDGVGAVRDMPWARAGR